MATTNHDRNGIGPYGPGDRGQGTIQSIRSVKMDGPGRGLSGIIKDTFGNMHVFLDPNWFAKYPGADPRVPMEVNFRWGRHEESKAGNVNHIWVLTDVTKQGNT